MAAKRGKSQARRNSGGGGSGMPGWAWLVLGVALTIGGVLLAPQLLNFGAGEGGFFRLQPKPDPDAKPAGGRGDDEALAGEAPPPDAKPAPPPPPTPPKEQEYSFYNVLSGEETALSDEELAARARAEASATPPTPPAPKPPVEDVPKPLETTATPTPAPTPPQAASGTSGNDNGSDLGKQDDDARYILQAGAFAASGDAEALKAKIAFLGLSARVESAQLQGKTMYRVRMGPYGSASELAEAKRKLANGGLPALAIRSR